MEYKNEAFTKILSDADYKQMLDELIAVIKRNKFEFIDLLFGVAWGNEYKNWTPFQVNIDSVVHEIKAAEDLNVGQFGNDDLYIIPQSETEILFCHEKDVHLRYNISNDLVKDILRLWQEKQLLHVERQLT